MGRRRALLPSGRLPNGYTEVEYIEATGTQYIHTGIIISDDFGAYADFSINTTKSWQSVLSARQDNAAKGFHLQFDSGLCPTGRFFIANSVFQLGIQSETRSIVSAINGVITKADGTTESYTSTGILPIEIVVFALKNGNSIVEKASAKVYSVKLYNVNTVVRDFVPCIQLSDNAVGMYDLVSNTFFRNAGTGTFIAGNPV